MKCINGVMQPLTDEDISELEEMEAAGQEHPALAPTLEERVTAVEESTEALKIIMGVEE